MAVTDRKGVASDQVLGWTISSGSFLQTANIKQEENVLWIGDSLPPAIIHANKARVVMASSAVFNSVKSGFDVAASQLGIHFLENGEEWLRQSFHLLNLGGRLVIDLAEPSALQQSADAKYIGSLPDYWDLLREIGFEAIFVQQIAVHSFLEAIEQGWAELEEEAPFPAAVNRFVALKGC